jgi:phytoene dehydrogenase-like protein
VTDAIVIGSGPNGLVAANLLADEGWSVTVLEAMDAPGGAVRTAELTVPGFHHDVFSAFYPLAMVSPPIRSLTLERWGLRWILPEVPVAHLAADGRVAAVGADVDETAACLDTWAPGDGDGWRRLYARWDRSITDSLLTPFPPLRGGVSLVRHYGLRELRDMARLALLPVRRLAEEYFSGEGGALLLAGNALHADLMPESAGSGLFGFLLMALAQSVGFPIPEGGAGRLTDALVRRLADRHGVIRCTSCVSGIEVKGGRAVAVRTVDGDVMHARRAILADVPAPALYLGMVGRGNLPPRLLDGLHRFQWDAGTVKVDWALDGSVPWSSDLLSRAGTVHIADSLDALTEWSARLATGRIPERPFLLLGQQGSADPTRSPPGTSTAWAYTHVPRAVKGDAGGAGITGAWTSGEADAMTERIEATVEAAAPGFTRRILGRHTFTPPSLEAANPSLVGGAINNGTAQLHQQLIFRPTPGWARAETPVAGLFLASASAHPGGGVHGACGANAARAALAADRRRRVRTAVTGWRERR